MRKLIRKKATKAFLMNGGEWTSNAQLAQHFRDAQAACKAADYLHLADVELYYLIEDTPSEYDFTIPIEFPQSPGNSARSQGS